MSKFRIALLVFKYFIQVKGGKIMASKWRTIFKSLAHALVGGGLAAGLAWLAGNVPAITAGMDSGTAAIVGSVISSLASAFSEKPNKA
jgi:hypothetical protein